MQGKNNKNITVIILSKNEEEVIEKAIKSALLLTRNVLVIDSFSTDRTPKIAKNLGARVITHAISDFSSQRNFALKNARTDWIFYLDSDEELSWGLVNEINEVVSSDTIVYEGFYVKRKTYYFGQDWKFTDSVQRLFLRDRLKGWEGVVHETPVISGEYGELKNFLHHNTHRNLSQMLAKTNEWSKYEAELRHSASHPSMNPLRFVRVMFTAFVNSYFKQNGWKNGTYGLIEGMYQAFSIFITYAKLWEMQEEEKMQRVKN